MTRPAALFAFLFIPIATSGFAAEPTTADNRSPIDEFLQPAGSTRQLAVPEPLEPTPLRNPDEELPPFYSRLEFHPHAELTHLLGMGDRGFGITDLEGQIAITIPFRSGIARLKIVPGAAIRWWETAPAPPGLQYPDLPAHVTDFYVDIGWRPRPAEWLFIDLKVTPGFYSDLNNTSYGAFRPRGHGMAIFAFSEQFQVVAGVAYVNRLVTRIVPAGGFRYAPNDDTEFRIIFPTPRISHRIRTARDNSFRVYLAGEFGGGAWAIRRDSGQDDVVDYRDLRLISGIEAELSGDRCWYAEFGYVFGRRLNYASEAPARFDLDDTLLFRIGFTY